MHRTGCDMIGAISHGWGVPRPTPPRSELPCRTLLYRTISTCGVLSPVLDYAGSTRRQSHHPQGGRPVPYQASPLTKTIKHSEAETF